MLAFTSVAGNIFSDKSWAEKYRRARSAGTAESLSLSRLEMERVRLRGKTDMGSDIGLVLDGGSRLQPGDVLYSREKIIIVEQLPERVVSIRIKNAGAEKMMNLAALVGHVIGNRHRPIAVDGKTISFPVQAESEVATFKKFLPEGIELKVKSQVFKPTVEVLSHE